MPSSLVVLLLGCQSPRSAAPIPEYGPFPLPTELGTPIQEVRKAVMVKVGSDEAVFDEEDRWVAQGPQWRSRFYVIEMPGLAVNVMYHHRTTDGKVWAISVRHAAGRYAGGLGPVDFNTNVTELESSLGRPVIHHSIAPVLDEYVWKRNGTVFVVEAYSQADDDIAAVRSKGAISSVLAYSTELGPPGFLGYSASP
jgi:hypothetical protein